MKQIILSLLIALFTVMGVNARTFVLVTGVSNYGKEDGNLRQTTKDAKRFKEAMESQTKDITLLTSKNVTKDNVLEKLRAICNRAQKDDQIIFFYSGHGMPGAICGYDKPIPYDDIIKVLSTSAAKEKICFIDACFAGTMAKTLTDESWTKAISAQKDQAFLVSCRPDEISTESPLLGAGFFTQALLKGLRGKSDTNGDRKITVMELFKYIHSDVTKRSSKREKPQHPQLIAPRSMYDAVVYKW